MATESPLFQSSMELLAHSISHFNAGAELDRKLLILHLANSVELLLKDLVLDAGESIYKNPKETVTIHQCLKTLEEKAVNLPYLNKVELLVDERNALQHRFGSPNELTAIFYMGIAMAFFKEVLADQYDLDLDETLGQFADPKELSTYRLREPEDESELVNLKALARIHPLGALLSATAYLERTLHRFGERIGDERVFRRPSGFVSHRMLARYGVHLPEELERDLDEVRRLRNYAAHGRKDPTTEEVVAGIDTIEAFEDFLSSVEVDPAVVQAVVEARSSRFVDRPKPVPVPETTEPGDGGSEAPT